MTSSTQPPPIRNPGLIIQAKRYFFSVLFLGNRGGAAWFFVGNAMPPFVAVLLGPLVLRKVGLEAYATLELAAYFFNLIAAYSDFNTSTHLLAAFSRGAKTRFSDLANAFALRIALWLIFAFTLLLMAMKLPRHDSMYALIALSLPAALLPAGCFDWYFIARRRYKQLFVTRAVAVLTQIILILGWYYSMSQNVLLVPAIATMSSATASIVLSIFLGKKAVWRGLETLGLFSVRSVLALGRKIAPMASVLLMGPYFVAYALPWYTIANDDPEVVGIFSIGYRIIIGLNALIVPVVLYMISHTGENSPAIRPFRVAGYSLLISVGCWFLGVIVIQYYIGLSGIDASHLGQAVQGFSILTIALFFLAFRTPFVASCLHGGHYVQYLLIHAFSCMPVLILSWLGRDIVSPQAVPWLACIPDAMAALLFLLRDRGVIGSTSIMK